MIKPGGGHLLRQIGAHEHARVTYIELFFDLVFVFAITQLSHSLLNHLTWSGALHVLLLFMAVWWVWIYTSWVTNWLDPERTPVRILLLALMLAGLMLSTSLPEAFYDKGLPFAIAYVFMQVGRSLFMLWGLGDANPVNTKNFQRITLWLIASAPLWIAGAIASGDTRLYLWIGALAIEYAGPSLGFWVPRMGRSTTGDWNVEGAHLAERCSLFIIIALGESILVTGIAFAELSWRWIDFAAFITAFIGTVAMWWIYFDTGAARGSERISHSSDPGRLARLDYTYLHLLIVAGIIVSAVADELILAHALNPPGGHAEPPAIAVIIGGPALYLLGNLLFKATFSRRAPPSHMVGLICLAVLTPAALYLPPILSGVATTAVLIMVATWETVSLTRQRLRDHRKAT
ncbi:MAG: low temperature requirement protein A [Rhodospirillales bacterium]